MSERKHCGNCKFENHDSNDEPCVSCDGTHIRTFTNWEPKSEPEKRCINCKHVDEPYEKSPCRKCDVGDLNLTDKEVQHTNFELKEKEEKKMDNRKTKAQLMEELEQKNAEIAELKKELERSEQYDQYVNTGKQIREMIDGFVEGGLSEDIAIKLVMGVVGEAAKWALK